MLLPAQSQADKLMPAGVAFALSATEITRLLAPTGVAPAPTTSTAPMDPATMADMATGMTALVSCWD